MNEMNIQNKKLIESLRLLSISYKEQKSYLPDFVDLPFELSDIYHNAFILLPNLIENDFLSYRVIANLMRLENILNNIMDNPLFENIEENDFLESQEWNNVRDVSKNILKEMGEPIIPPDSNYI